MNSAQTIRRTSRKFDELAKRGDQARASHRAAHYEEILEERYGNDPEFNTWDRNRALNRQDFDYLFYHRTQFLEEIKTHLEFIASKITHVRTDEEDGYFNKLERNVGWTKHITPLVFSQTRNVDKLVRCGIWASAENSRRCHDPECPNCHWNDILKVAVEAFGSESGTFLRMQSKGLTPFFITLSFTTHRENAKCVGRDFNDSDISFKPGSTEYDPYPVHIGNDSFHAGYEDAKLLGLTAQKAIEKVYKDKLLSGYRFKIEAAFKLVPGEGSRVNLHSHIVANGPAANPQVIADALIREMRLQLRRYRKHLHGTLIPDVLVLRLNSPEELERAVKYSEKVIPFGLIVEDAMNQPEAKRSDGSWNPAHIDQLNVALHRLVNDDIPAIFGGTIDPLFKPLRRRKSAGNMTFNDRGTCIGQEPLWHKRIRWKRAQDQKERRNKRKEADEIMEKPRKPIRKHKRHTSRRDQLITGLKKSSHAPLKCDTSDQKLSHFQLGRQGVSDKEMSIGATSNNQPKIPSSKNEESRTTSVSSRMKTLLSP